MTEDVPGYRVLEKAGEGAFGVVHRAHRERPDRQVALKVLSAGPVDGTAMERFRRECGIVGRLGGHPNVAAVLETGSTPSGRPYIATEYFEQGSLADRIAREGPLPLPEALRIGVKAAGALAAAHEAGVLHGGVKPQNILMSRHGEPALADFGVALLAGPSRAPHHTAPEVLEGGRPGVPSDVYSLGSTLYHLLAGTPAFGRPPGEFTPLPPIRRDDVPAPVHEVIRTAMAKTPGQRFASAAAFARRLQRLQDELGLPVTDLARDPAEVTEIGSPPDPRASAEPDGAAASPPDPPLPGSAPSQRVAAATAVLVGVVIGGIVVAGALGGDGDGLAPRPKASTPARSTGTPTSPPDAAPVRTAPPISQAQIRAAAPRLVRLVSDRRTSVALRWWLPSGSRQSLIVVRPAPWKGRSIVVGKGVNAAALRGMRPGVGYCFRVGAVLRRATVPGGKAVVAWSKPLCIRGARAG